MDSERIGAFRAAAANSVAIFLLSFLPLAGIRLLLFRSSDLTGQDGPTETQDAFEQCSRSAAIAAQQDGQSADNLLSASLQFVIWMTKR